MINENKRIAESQQKIQQISKMLVGYLPVRKKKVKMHKHRTFVVNEILATEVHYISALKQIIEVRKGVDGAV